MKINELNEGPLDTIKDIGKTAYNVGRGGLAAIAGNKDGVKKASDNLSKQKAGRSRTNNKKMKVMADAMLKAWKKHKDGLGDDDKADNIEFEGWVHQFMGSSADEDRAAALQAEPPSEEVSVNVSDSEAKSYFNKIIPMFYKPEKNVKPTQSFANREKPEAEPEPTDAEMDKEKQGFDARHSTSRTDHAMNDKIAQKKIDNDRRATAAAAAATRMAKQKAVQDKIPAGNSPTIGPKPTPAEIRKVKQQVATRQARKELGQVESLERNLTAAYLTEAAGKNTHMEHIEDIIFDDGFDGAKAAQTYLNQVIAMLSKGTGNKAKVTVKWDGAPAIICGTDPADGRFFVGTKSVFAKTKNMLVKTVKNANDMYPEQPELRDILILCLKQLKKLGIGGIVQGDLMFHPVGGEKAPVEQEIDGEKVLTFGPNTITYAVPSKSKIADKIRRAKIGIVFHTTYDGADMQSMSASYGFNAGSLNQVKDVWADDATYKDVTGIGSFTPEELKKVQTKMNQLDATMAKIKPAKFNVVLDNKEFKGRIKPFINQLIRQDVQPGSVNVQQFLKDFYDFYAEKIHAEIEKKQMDPESRAYKTRMLKLRQQEEFLEDNMNSLAGVLAVFKRIAEAKMLLVSKMSRIEGFGTFVKDGDGYKVVEPEGFVAIGHSGGAVKLVDRLEFSKNNFAAGAKWKDAK